MLRVTLENDIYKYIKDRNVRESIPLNDEYKVSFLAQGEYNINFVVEDSQNKYVFRVNTGSQIQVENQIKYEYDALKVLQVTGVTPEPLYLDHSKDYLPYGILIMEFLKGRPLEYDKDLRKAGKIFGGIHSLDINKIPSSNFIVESNILSDRIKEGERLLVEFLKSPIIHKELKDFFYDFLNWCYKNKHKERYFIDNKWHVINNTEVNSHNFIVGQECSYLIDWEKPVISDPCQDITQFLAPTTTLWKANYILTEEEKDSFYDEYIKSLRNGDRNIKERVKIYNPYLYLRALSWCAYAYLEYQKPDKDIKNMDTFSKIKEYLDMDFMKNLLREYF